MKFCNLFLLLGTIRTAAIRLGITTMKQAVLWILLLALVVQVRCKCPRSCYCSTIRGRKNVLCDKGGMSKDNPIPVHDMDDDINVLTITAPPNNPNFLKLGHIFDKFSYLEEITITHSNIPSLGDNAFWQVQKLTVLNLSYNNITRPVREHFSRLGKLKTLDLSNNNIENLASAVFMNMTNLRHLSLARNKLKDLAPRLFFKLPYLESLNLSSNVLDGFEPEHIQDLLSLKRLDLSNCSLSSLHPSTYKYLKNLEEFNLRHNNLTTLRTSEFHLLARLRDLYLDHNLITTIENGTFYGHNLEHLGLSHNTINDVQSCAFCNASIVHLDISHNRISSLSRGALVPLSEQLITLDLSYNRIPAESLSRELLHLPNLEELSLQGCEMNRIPADLFSRNYLLREINLSHNVLLNLTDSAISSLQNLTVLDLSSNKISSLKNSTLLSFEAIEYVYLDENPWSCTVCDMTDVLLWVRSSSVYGRSCAVRGRCIKCSNPENLADKRIESLLKEELGPCVAPHTGSRVGLPMNAQLGIIIAVCVLALLLVVVIIVLLFRYHGAVYYTHEEEMSDDGDKTSLTNSSVGFGDDKKPVFIATIEKMDERLEEKSSDKNTIG